ncbi:Wzz/FepE/Etk N-terminal domain-containing protein [Dankookia sp. GCM10030260]|uniref:Wzz/FepE/Etk N-terminal domain-containing protein n=1 Tax=Dankookia sp. GCM10030260 TaxID=3273390 RepID=UPI00361FEB50
MTNAYTQTDMPGLSPNGSETPPFRWLPGLLRFLRRRWLTIAGTAAVVLGLAVLYLLVATAQFTATTALLVDIRQSNPFRQQPLVTDAQSENTMVESQVEVIRSEGLARALVAQLDLVNDAAFNAMGPGIIGSVVGFLTGSDGPANAEKQKALAVERLMRLIGVRRVGMTAVIEVSVRTPDRELSARLANALVEVYLQRQVAALSGVSSMASGWMQKRVKELRDEAIAADRAVQDYRAAHNILDTDKGQFNAQQLGDFSLQQTIARTRRADAQAKFDRINAISPDRLVDAPMAEAIENTVIVGLRKQYLDARRRESEWSSRYGANHTAAVNARNEMAELQGSIRNELSRISETYRSELEVAKANEAELTRQLGVLAAATAAVNSDRIMLRALQSAADSYKAIYENFLTRYTQAVQDQSFPITEARVMSAAVPPLKKSSPKAVIALGLGLVMGLLLGFGLAILRELLDQGLRTPAQIKAATGTDCLGMLPRIAVASRGMAPGHAAEPSLRQLPTYPSALRQVVDQPGSPFAEAMRGIALRTVWRRRTPGSQVIGCVAPRAGEGASTIAANLAYAFAEAGYNTLLVDLDLRGGDLTRALAPQNAGGAAEIAEGAMPLEQVVWRDPQAGLHFLPSAAGRSAAHPARVLAPLRADRLLAALRAGYDRVVIDLPAAGGAADASVLAELLDGLLLVSSWGGLEGEALAEVLDGLHGSRDRLLGVVLNRVELRRLEQYGAAGHVPAPRPEAVAVA